MKVFCIGSVGGWQNCRVVFDKNKDNSINARLENEEGTLLLAMSENMENIGENVFCMKRGHWANTLLDKMSKVNAIHGWTYSSNLVFCVANMEDSETDTRIAAAAHR